MTNEPLIYHKDTQSEGLFTEPQLRYVNLSPSHFANALHYATTGFEGARADVDHREGVLYGILLDKNIARLEQTLKYLRIVQPEGYGDKRLQFERNQPEAVEELEHRKNPLAQTPEARFLDFDPESLEANIRETIIRNYEIGILDDIHIPNQGIFVYIRPVGYRGDMRNGRDIADNLGVYSLGHEPVLEISVRAARPYLKTNPKLIVSEKGVIGDHLHVKLGANYVPYGQGKCDAIFNGFNEILMTTPREDRSNGAIIYGADSLINEGGGENFFGLTQDGVIITPPVDTKRILPGTKRNLVIELAKNLGIRVEEEDIHLSDLKDLKSVFLSGTWAGVEEVEMIYDPKTDKVHFFNPGAYEPVNLVRSEYNSVLKGGPLEAKSNEAVRNRVRSPILSLDRKAA